MDITKEKINEFLDRLEGPEGCDFRYEGEGESPENIRWTCAGGYDKSLAKKILSDMGFNDNQVAEILEYANENGGHCDCEILFNAEDALLRIYGGEE